MGTDLMASATMLSATNNICRAALTRNIMTIFDYWQATLYVDFGSENGAIWGPSTVAIHPVPPADDKTKDKSKATLPWNYMFSGGIAGAISRTATAPLVRTKEQLLDITFSSPNKSLNFLMKRRTG
jgi:hypothetical protein